MSDSDERRDAANVPPDTQTGTVSDRTTVGALPLLTPGTVFGPYRVLGPLGRGGMGVVYEAEEIENGRRVALKVSGRPFEDARARERFLREGRLAAAINHPRCVYIFGATEIDGHPVIAMEPMQGTLAQRLQRSGPMAPAEAVDAILQAVEGLEAAAEADILHRDIKPSNCFVDDDGVVKIGDFGISRSAHPTDEMTQLTLDSVVGTPAYASPEQIRGSELDLRSDIYSVGATLFELLTGRPPFVGRDVMAMLMAVASEAAPAPSALNPAVPKGLSDVVLRCLAKRPDQRFADYRQLAAALEPYGTGAVVPSPLGRRFIAGAIDFALLFFVFVIVDMAVPALDVGDASTWGRVKWSLSTFLIFWIYFGVLEQLCGATAGKALSRIAVRGTDTPRASSIRLLGRAALFSGWFVVIRLVAGWAPTSLEQLLGGPLAFLAVQALAWSLLFGLFVTARRRNGFSALHDLATGTRVVERRELSARPVRTVFRAPDQQEITGRAGPYDVLGGTIQGLGVEWRRGFDPILRRPVWIRLSNSGTPQVSAVRRRLNRVARLRWLAGQRLDDGAWDAFEAVDGVPLSEASRERRDWADVRWWLLDVARECAAMTPIDGAPRSPQHVWVLASGHVKWLDDPIAGRPAPSDVVATDQQLLMAIARTALRGPLPLGAQRFLDRLRGAAGEDIQSVVAEVENLSKKRAVLTRAWRAIPLLVCTVAMLLPLAIDTVSHLITGDRKPAPLDERVAAAALSELILANHGWIRMSADDRQAIEAALATRYRNVLAEGRLLGGPRMGRDSLAPEREAIARELLQRSSDPLPVKSNPMAPRVEAIVKRVSALDGLAWHQILYMRMFSLYLTAVAVALILNFAFRGGLMRAMGRELVTSNGRQASRWRVLVRTALTWSPILLVPIIRPFAERALPGVEWIPWLMLGISLGAIAILLTPPRGLQDRIAGTWVVPR